MITRPVLEGIFNNTAQTQSAVHTILFDDSFSQNRKKVEILQPLNILLNHMVYLINIPFIENVLICIEIA